MFSGINVKLRNCQGDFNDILSNLKILLPTVSTVQYFKSDVITMQKVFDIQTLKI